MLLNVGKHFPPDVPSGAPDRKVALAKTLLNPETKDGVGCLSFEERGSLKFSHGFRVNTDQDLVHDVNHHAEEHENHHLCR